MTRASDNGSDSGTSENRRKSTLFAASASIVLFFVNGTTFFSLPYFYPAIIDELAWTREQTTLFASFQFGSGVVAAVVCGYLADRWNASRLLPITVAIAGFSMIGLSVVETLPTYYWLAVMLGIGAPGCMVLTKFIVTRSFSRNLGFGLGCVLLGSGSAAFIMPPVLVGLQSSLDWRGAALGVGLCILCVALPLAVLLLRSHAKSTESLLAQADTVSTDMGNDAPSNWSHQSSRLGVLRSRSFILIAVGIFLASAASIGMYQHSPLFLSVDLGFSAALIATAGSLFGILGFAIRPIMGAGMDRFSFKAIAFCYALLVLAAGWSQILTTPVAVIVWMTLLGIAHGGLVIAAPLIAKHEFLPSSGGVVIGGLTSIRQLGFAIGPWIMGRTYDRAGSYDSAFLLWGAACTLALITIIFVVPKYRQGSTEVTLTR